MTSRPPRTGNNAGSKGPGLLTASTATLIETPDSVREASARRTPSTVANASSSSGSTRPSIAARARSSPASSSKATRRVGRQARCHASAPRSAPPAAKAVATVMATARALEIDHAHSAAAAPQINTVDASGWMISGARNPTREPASMPRAGMAATVRKPSDRAKFGATAHHDTTKITKDTKLFRSNYFVSFVLFVTSGNAVDD